MAKIEKKGGKELVNIFKLLIMFIKARVLEIITQYMCFY
jgi:hypothetical protein